ncbi:hypothetical protein F4859DRAFT_511132 [Xylaria cf. heliscus]|nr:hypothetical protein F4859DRAFT_511132 [Xylaria cf. heliscus]
MGSLISDKQYPDASDGSLVLTHPTAAEKEQTWRLNHREWGGALDLPAYLEREPFLASTPLAADGGMMHWILTDSTAPATDPQAPGEKKKDRSVLASCETIRKRVLYAPRTGDSVGEGLGYGIGSVYTYPEFRGRKYAARMLRELGGALKTWPAEEQLRKKRSQAREQGHDGNGNGNGNGSSHATDNGPGSGERTNRHAKLQKAGAEKAVCSALWSDIGKKFYAAKGWPVYPSEHVEFSSACATSQVGVSSLLEKSLQPPHHHNNRNTSLTLTPVNTSNLAQLCREDEAQLRAELTRHARETGRTAFAFAPEYDVFRWHWAREEFIASRVFPERPASGVRGMIATVRSAPATHNGSGKVDRDTKEDEGREGEGEGEGEGTETETETRMWAIWTRNYGADAASSPEKNTLYILRLVIDDSNSSSSSSTSSSPPDSAALQLAFDAIMQSALDAARPWSCGTVHLWNPTPVVRALIAGSAIAHKFVDREVDSIPSMMWYGADADEGEEEPVDWIANEKYCWC